jgi:hypothetical protein
MGPLTALVLATPIFGFSLAPPQLDALPYAGLPVAQLEASADLELAGDASADDARAESSSSVSAPAEQPDQAVYVQQMRKRAKLAKMHRTLGISSWAAMTLAVISGTIQYRNLYGGGELGKTPCVTGEAWLGQGQCSDAPLVHAIPGFVAGGLYFATMGLEIFMPDPDHAAEGDSKYAKNLRLHKLLRWVHLTGMVAQIAMGVVMANPGLGLERATDYKTLQAMSRAHLGIGYVTYGALTWAGTIMLF